MVEVTMLTSPDGPCGIGTYASDLVSALPDSVDVQQTLIPPPTVWNPIPLLRGAIEAGLADGDLVHVQHEYGLYGKASIYSWFVFPVLWLLTRISGAPLVLTIHSAWTEEMAPTDTPRQYPVRFYIWLNNAMLATVADVLIFLSAECCEDFNSSVDVDSQTIHHGVNLDTFDFSQAEAKRQLGFDPERTLVVEPGYIREQKGCHRFVDLAEAFPEYEFVLAGGPQGGHEDYAERIEASAPENLSITGHLDDPEFHAAFAAADLIVLPYVEMSQSGVFNYCAAYATPVATTDHPYFRRITDEWGCPVLFDDDTEAMISTVDRLLDSPLERERVSERLEVYANAHSFESAAEEHESLYQSTVQR